MREKSADPLAEFRRVNAAGTRRLAESAAQAGVRRFVYVSSIKVNGERTGNRPFTEADPPGPEDAYAQSKYEAEMALREIAARTGMEVVIVRPPLVYGPGVKGNFRTLLRVVRMGLPLPLASCDNRRSLVGLSNLADLLALCVTHPAAAGETFLAADGEDLSTPELLRRTGRALGRPARLFPVPPALLRAGARMFGRAGAGERLCGSLQVDISRARRILGWNPPSTVDEELARTAQWYQQHCTGRAKG
jgi:nucleoside-diphosphate-sugar epimerase